MSHFKQLFFFSIKRQKVVFTLVLLSVKGAIFKNFHLLIVFFIVNLWTAWNLLL